MNKNILKSTLSIFIFVIFLIPIITSSILDLKQKKVEKIIQQNLLQEEIKKQEVLKIETKNYLTGKFDPKTRIDFILVPIEYTTNKNEMYLRKETLEAFLKMQKEAEKDEINLKIASATRNFESQKYIWNNKWTGVIKVNEENLSISIPNSLERFKKILEYSAVPGTSRHHFGTDIDINNATLEYFKSEVGIKTYEWLIKNAYLFGFCQPYNLKGTSRPTGYNEEKWHWSYLPLAKTFTQKYKNLIKDEDLNGFLGDENVIGQDLINNYVLGINPDCL